jgi:drug/metabolite transporter (DMT)-like permease
MTPRQLAMLLGLAALWGASFVFMRVAVPALGPIVLADARVAIAGTALLGYAAAIGARPALRARWRDYLLLGAVNAALPFSLLAAAQSRSRRRWRLSSTRWLRSAVRSLRQCGSATA